MSKEFAKALVYFLLVASLFGALSWAKFHSGHRASLPQASYHGLLDQGGADILLMGSSLARMGYDPRIVEQATGQSVYVVAYNGMGPAYMHALLKHLLETEGVRPRLIVLEGSVLTASMTPAIRDKNLFFNAAPNLKRSLLQLLAEQPGGVRFAQWYDLVIAAKNQDIVCHPLVGPALAGVFYRGAHLQAPESFLTPEAFAQVAPYPTDLEPFDPRQIYAFLEIFALLEKHRIPAAFVGPAVPAPLYDIPVIREKQDALAKFFQDRGFDYLDGTRGFPNHDPTNYFDGRHFSAKGRTLFSHFFANQLHEHNLLF